MKRERVRRAIAPQACMEMMKYSLSHPNAQLRALAVWATGKVCCERRWGPAAFVHDLAKLAADPDSEVRKRAARQLPDLGKARLLAVPTLQSLRNASQRRGAQPRRRSTRKDRDQVRRL